MGGTQFVGAAVAKYWIASGHNVDIFTRGILPVTYSGIRHILQGDRRNLDSMHKALSDKEYNVIFDISAYTGEDVAILTNIVKNHRLQRYVLLSSGAVYAPFNGMYTEDMPRGLHPAWGRYGLEKIDAEDTAFRLYDTIDFPVTIVRPSYIYGIGNNLYREQYFFERMLSRKEIPIPASEVRNQFIYIEDVAIFLSHILESERSIGQAYNLTHRRQYSWREILNICSEVVGEKAVIREISSQQCENLGISVRNFFPFRDITYLLSSEKLRSHGFHDSSTDLHDGLRKTFAWYLHNLPSLTDKQMTSVEMILNAQLN